MIYRRNAIIGQALLRLVLLIVAVAVRVMQRAVERIACHLIAGSISSW